MSHWNFRWHLKSNLTLPLEQCGQYHVSLSWKRARTPSKCLGVDGPMLNRVIIYARHVKRRREGGGASPCVCALPVGTRAFRARKRPSWEGKGRKGDKRVELWMDASTAWWGKLTTTWCQS